MKKAAILITLAALLPTLLGQFQLQFQRGGSESGQLDPGAR